MDIIVEYKNRIITLEIKHTVRPRQEDFKGIMAFRDAAGCDSAFLGCTIERPQKFQGGMALHRRELEFIFQ